ncbi:MAG: SDR family NAD(P)-dependent oxidoreductase [Propionibacteriaceae bacterium]|jgi:short-subunit dehydrogenase|nr:SDR family NAD(P)-dependent oxidoreductase [Propionibacteriaceae bacterium]
MATALITGGTVGLGRAFATRLARDGWDLVLASRDAAGLEAAAAEFRATFGVTVEVIPTDLSVRSDTLALAGRLEDASRPIDLLVNNAGFGLHDSLVTLDPDKLARAIEVMDIAPAILQAAAARAMTGRGKGGIINVTSSAGTLTTGAYSAVKAWLTIMTESLAIELRGTGVRVVAVLPGWVETEFHSRAGIKANAFPPFLKKLVYVTPERVVATALDGLAKDRVVCVPGRRWAFAVWLARVIPKGLNRKVSGALTHSRT